MTSLNKTYRQGLDVDVALQTAFRHVQSLNAPGQLDGNDAQPLQESVEAPAGAVAPEGIPTRARIKALLRMPVKACYRLLRPFIRPVAFRLRAYFTILVRDDIQRAHAATLQEVNRVTADMLREVQASREILRQEILSAARVQQPEPQRLLISVMQDIQATRDQLLRGIRDLRQQNTVQFDALRQESHTMSDALRIESAAMGAALAEKVAGATDIQRAALDGIAAVRGELLPRLDRLEQYGYATARRVFVNCADNEVLLRTEAGLLMCSNSDYAVLACLVDSGDLERGTRLLIERLVRPGDVFIDVGANLGIHTLAAARALQGRGKVIAFEPFAGNRTLLEKSVMLNGYADLVEIHGVALSDRAASLPLYLGSSSGHHSLFDLQQSGLDAHTVSVDTRTLDSMVTPSLPVRLVKIDVEGAELQVLAGAAALVAAQADIALIVEFGPSHLKRTGSSTAEWLSAFTAHGLTYRGIDALDGTLAPADHATLEAAESTNLLFARPQSPVWQLAGGLP
jgi:FkbM family methyltransferase